MNTIDEHKRAELVNGFRKLVDAFNDEDACFDKVAPEHMRPEHYKFILDLMKVDVVNVDDARLYELCKEFDATFVVGDYGYTAEQNRAINNLVDLVFV